MEVKSINGYVGLYAHNFDEAGRILNQMQIVHQLPDGRLICQMHEFISGSPTIQQTFTTEDTKDWQFYTSKEDWKFGYGHLEGKWALEQKAKAVPATEAEIQSAAQDRLKEIFSAKAD